MKIRTLALASFALVSLAGFSGQTAQADSAEKFAAAEIPLTLTSFGAARLGDKVYIYGGHTGEAHSYSNDMQSNQLLSLDLAHPDQPWKVESESVRLQGLALVAYDGKVIRVGGFSALNAAGVKPAVLKSTAEVAAYDIASGKWEELPALPEPRSSHDAILVGSKIYVIGGWQLDGETKDSKWADKAFVLDLAAAKPQWSEIAAPSFKRRALSLAQLGDSIIAIGGMEEKGITKHTSIYSPAENAWHEGPDLVGEGDMMGFGTAAVAVDGAALISAIDGSLQELKVGENEWKPCGKTEDARFFHELIPLDAHRVLVLGGANMEEHQKFQNVEVINLP